MDAVAEPVVRAHIVTPAAFIGNVQKLCHERRGLFKGMSYLDPRRVEMDFELPLAEIVLDFYGRLKGGTKGYAALDYEFQEYRPGDLVKLDILVNREPGRRLLGDSPPRQRVPPRQFAGPETQGTDPQAAVRGGLAGRDRRSGRRPADRQAVRKNVTAKCYGGDITRKRKLLERQREGKTDEAGRVGGDTAEAFMAVLQLDDDRS